MNSSPTGRSRPGVAGLPHQSEVHRPDDDRQALEALLNSGNTIDIHIEPRREVAHSWLGPESKGDEPRGMSHRNRRSLIPAILAGEPSRNWPETQESPDQPNFIGKKVDDLVFIRNEEELLHLKLEKTDLDFLQGDLLAWRALENRGVNSIEFPGALTELPAGMRLLRGLRKIHLPNYNGQLLNLLPYQGDGEHASFEVTLSGDATRRRIEVIFSGRKSAIRMVRDGVSLAVCAGQETSVREVPGRSAPPLAGKLGKLEISLTDIDTRLLSVLEKGWSEEKEIPLPRQISNVELRERAANLQLLMRSKHEPTALEMLQGLLLERKKMTASELLSLLFHPRGTNDDLQSNLHTIRTQRWDIFEHVLESFYMRQEFVDQLDDLEVCLLGNMWLSEPTATYTDRSAALRMVFARYSGVMKLARFVRNPKVREKLLLMLAHGLESAKQQSTDAGKPYQAHTKEYLECLYFQYSASDLESVRWLINELDDKQSDGLSKFDATQRRCIEKLLAENWELLPYEKSIVSTIKTRTLLLSLIPPNVFVKCSKAIFDMISAVSGGRYESVNLPPYLPCWPKGVDKCITNRIEVPYFRGSKIDLTEALQNRPPNDILVISLGERDAGRETEPDLIIPEETSVALIINAKLKMRGSAFLGDNARSSVVSESTLWPSREGTPRAARRKVKRQKLSPDNEKSDDSNMLICSESELIDEKVTIQKWRQQVWGVVNTVGPREQLKALDGLIRDHRLTAAEKFEVFQHSSDRTDHLWLLSVVVTPTLERLLLGFLFSDGFLGGLDQEQLQHLSHKIILTELTCTNAANQKRTMREQFVNAALSKNLVLRLPVAEANRYLQAIGNRVGRVLRQREIQRPLLAPPNWSPTQLNALVASSSDLKKGIANLLNHTCWFWQIAPLSRPDDQETSEPLSYGTYIQLQTKNYSRMESWAQMQVPELTNAARQCEGKLIVDLSIIEPDLIPRITQRGWAKLVRGWRRGNSQQGLFKGLYLPPGLTEFPTIPLNLLGVGLKFIAMPGYRGITLDVAKRKIPKSKSEAPLVINMGFSERMPHISFSNMREGSECEYRWIDLRNGVAALPGMDDLLAGSYSGDSIMKVQRLSKIAAEKKSNRRVESPSSTSDELSYELNEAGTDKASEKLRSIKVDSETSGLVTAACELLQYHDDPIAPMLWLKQQMKRNRKQLSGREFQILLRKFKEKKEYFNLGGKEAGSFLRFILRGLKQIPVGSQELQSCVRLAVDLIQMIIAEEGFRSRQLSSPWGIQKPPPEHERRAAVFTTLQKSGSAVMRDIKYRWLIAIHAKEYAWYSWSCVGDRMEFPRERMSVVDESIQEGDGDRLMHETEERRDGGVSSPGVNDQITAPGPIYVDDVIILEHLSEQEAEAEIKRLLDYAEHALAAFKYVILPHGLTDIPEYVKWLTGCRVLVANNFTGSQVHACRLPMNVVGARSECVDFVCKLHTRPDGIRKRRRTVLDVECVYDSSFREGHHYIRVLSENGIRLRYPDDGIWHDEWVRKWVHLIESYKSKDTAGDIQQACREILDAGDIALPQKIHALITGFVLKKSCESRCGDLVPKLLLALFDKCFPLGKVESKADLLLISALFEMFRRFNWFQWCDRESFQTPIDDSFLAIAIFMESLKENPLPEVVRHVRREQLFWLDDIRTSMTRQRVRPGYLKWYIEMTGLSREQDDQAMIGSLVEKFQEFRLDRLVPGDTRILMKYFENQRIRPNSPFAREVVRALAGNTLNLTTWSQKQLSGIDIDLLNAFEQQAGKKKITRLNLPARLENIPDCASLMKDLDHIWAPEFRGQGVDLGAWEFGLRQGSMLTFDICSEGSGSQEMSKLKQIIFRSCRQIAVLAVHQDNKGNASYEIVFPSMENPPVPSNFEAVLGRFEKLLDKLNINEKSIQVGNLGAGLWVETLYFLLEHIDSFKGKKDHLWWVDMVRRLMPKLVYVSYPKGVAYLAYKIVQGLYSSSPCRPAIDLQYTLIEQCAHSSFLGALLDSELTVLLPLLLASAHDNKNELGWCDLKGSIELLQFKAQGCGLQIDGGWVPSSSRDLVEPMNLAPPSDMPPVRQAPMQNMHWFPTYQPFVHFARSNTLLPLVVQRPASVPILRGTTQQPVSQQQVVAASTQLWLQFPVPDESNRQDPPPGQL